MAKKDKKQKNEYSKALLIQESALIWILTIGMLGLAYLCIVQGYVGTIPWLAAMVAFPWTAYGVSQAMYYRKSEKENTKNGIKFESVMAEVNALYGSAAQNNTIDWSVQSSEDQSGLNTTTNTSNSINLNYGI